MGILKETIESLNIHRPAILVGNGINRLSDLFTSWDNLLKTCGGVTLDTEGLTNTEIYDFIELKQKGPNKLKSSIAGFFKVGHKPPKIHQNFIQLMIEKDCPVLTTNFDLTFEQSILSSTTGVYETPKIGFTRFYPWNNYFALKQLALPTDGFGIWHIHGTIDYCDSIRLGLSDYMGSVTKARKLIHKGDDSIFDGKNRHYWRGVKSWLHIWFNMPIIIVGLGLRSDEVFIRWLFIEREKYFIKFPDRRKETFYLNKGDCQHLDSFLKNLKIELIKTTGYESLYC